MSGPTFGDVYIEKVDKTKFAEYKEKLARKLLKYNFHSEVISNNTELKNFIENYVVDNVINNVNKHAIIGISKKLANMDIGLPNGEHVTFPIIHTYKYHNLLSTTIFYINENNECIAEDIELSESPLIIT